MKIYKHPHKTGWLRVIGDKINNAYIQMDIARDELPTAPGQAKQVLISMMAEREATIQPPALQLDPEFAEP